MSELLPNLDELRELLSGTSAANVDARALTEAAARAATETELVAAVKKVIEQWRQA